MRDGKLKEDVDRMRKMSVFKKMQNITLEEYLTLLEQMKQAALSDMDLFPEKEKYTGDIQPGSFLSVRLRYRDDEDCLYADCSSLGPRHFVRLHPYLWQFMEEESEELLRNEDFDEPVENKFYWEVTKYIRCRDRFYEQYAVIYSLKLEMLGVEGYPYDFERKAFRDSKYQKCFTEEQKFILVRARQLKNPMNVVLPYHPGDILYVDANPFGKPFYAVYCAETVSDREHFEWTKKEYGFYKREHPCLYISEDRKGLDITNLCGWFTDYIPFPYAPLDRIKVVDTCCDPALLKAAEMLKENPAIFWKWLDWRETGQSLEEKILAVRGVSI